MLAVLFEFWNDWKMKINTCSLSQVQAFENGIFRVFFFIHKLKNGVFVHNFLSHQTLELPEILNSSKRLTNLKCNEERFSKFEYLHFLRPFFDFFVVFFRFFKWKYQLFKNIELRNFLGVFRVFLSFFKNLRMRKNTRKMT